MDLFFLKNIAGYLKYRLLRPHRKGRGISDDIARGVMSFLSSRSKGEDFSAIEALRREMGRSMLPVANEDFGAGSRTGNSVRIVKKVVRTAASSAAKGRLLYRLVKYFHPGTILELGTSVGLGTLYMAYAGSLAKIYTVEGNSTLVSLAAKNFQRLGKSGIHLIHGNFDDVLPDLLAKTGRIDFLYLDGNHRRGPTMKYFHAILPYFSENAIMVLDDIRWSKEMLEAWREICSHPSTGISVDCYTFGVVFFRQHSEKSTWKVYCRS